MALAALRLSRNQLASFIKDAEAVKQFERLVSAVSGLVRFGAGTAIAAYVWPAPMTLAAVVDLAALAEDAFGTTPTGLRATVNDSTAAAAGNFGAVITGGGAELVPAYFDGTDWRIG